MACMLRPPGGRRRRGAMGEPTGPTHAAAADERARRRDRAAAVRVTTTPGARPNDCLPPPMRFVLNGAAVEVAAHPMKRLLDVLREDCGLTGTKEGCGEGECGACTVLVTDADGTPEPVCACLVPFAQVRGASVTTIEGLGGDHPLQRAFAAEGGAQCGICTPGMIMAALALMPPPPAVGGSPPAGPRAPSL